MERFEEILKEINDLANQKGPEKIQKLNDLDKEARDILKNKNIELYSARENSLSGKKITG
ncbi:MAG: hypothetical protein ACOYMB_02910 [Patescibacteria group bacterium]